MSSKPIWFKPYTAADYARGFPGTLQAHLGIEIVEVGPDYIRGRMPVDGRTRQPYGQLHGGASVALAETLGSVATAMTLDTDKFICVGQEINANHLRAVRDGFVIGTARRFHAGATSQVWGIEIRDGEERLVCVSRITMAVRPRVAERALPDRRAGFPALR
jgi:1,4-dihydroxy-2-naphthoyl-CoA hydrolase